jgi:hypothetical protein
MILDGVLEKYKVLLIVDSIIIPEDTLNKITTWCKEKGGVFITNNKPKINKNLLDKTRIEQGKTILEKIGTGLLVTYRTTDLEDYYKTVYKILVGKDEIVKLDPVIDDVDGEFDKVYATVTAEKELLLLNDSNKEIQKKCIINGKQETVELEQYSIKGIEK